MQCVLQATDVYALGVLLWEMFHCSRVWPGMSFADIVQAVAVHQRRLPCSPDMPLVFEVSQQAIGWPDTPTTCSSHFTGC